MDESITNIVTVEQMLFLEKMSDKMGVSLATLMDNAGRALGRRIYTLCTQRGIKTPLILAGKGNNGGDGFVAAGFLFEKGLRPEVVLVCGRPATELSLAAFEKMHAAIPVITAEDMPTVCEKITQARLLVDCIFGTGFKGEISEELRPIFEAIEANRHLTLACDVPSGVNARSGQVSTQSVRAEETFTMHACKLGMLLSPARYWCGKISVEDIGIPPMGDLPELENKITLAEGDEFCRLMLPKRPPWGHKGTFGRVVCLCGSERYMGAAGIAVRAALRTGAGLVELCSVNAVVNALAGQVMECIYTRLPDRGGIVSREALPVIKERLQGASALLIGCGLGCNEDTRAIVEELIKTSPVPIILDADGINSLGTNIDILSKKDRAVTLTPHPAELARLFGAEVSEVNADRYRYARALAEQYGVTVVAKGAETLIVHGHRCTVVRRGNTALAKGGSGDMLAGMIASLTAQAPKDSLYNACLGCCLMGGTAEMLSERLSPRGITAADIISALPEFLKKLEVGD